MLVFYRDELRRPSTHPTKNVGPEESASGGSRPPDHDVSESVHNATRQRMVHALPLPGFGKHQNCSDRGNRRRNSVERGGEVGEAPGGEPVVVVEEKDVFRANLVEARISGCSSFRVLAERDGLHAWIGQALQPFSRPIRTVIVDHDELLEPGLPQDTCDGLLKKAQTVMGGNDDGAGIDSDLPKEYGLRMRLSCE